MRVKTGGGGIKTDARFVHDQRNVGTTVVPQRVRDDQGFAIGDRVGAQLMNQIQSVFFMIRMGGKWLFWHSGQMLWVKSSSVWVLI